MGNFIAYIILFLVAGLGAWFHHEITPAMQRAADHLLGDTFAMPAGFRLALQIGPMLWWLPVIVLLLYLLSLRFQFLRSSVVVSLWGALLAVIFVLDMGLFLVLPSVFAGSPPLPPPVEAVLKQGEIFELYSLDPVYGATNSKTSDTNVFHEYHVLGKVSISNADTRQALIVSLVRSIKDNSSLGGACFEPRHAIHAVRDGKAVDLIICFRCGILELFEGNQRTVYLINQIPRDRFNQTLIKANIPLAGQ